MKERIKREYLKAKLLSLFFYRSPQSNLSQTNKKVIRNIKSWRSSLEKALIK